MLKNISLLLIIIAVFSASFMGCGTNIINKTDVDIKWISNKKEMITSGACGGDQIKEQISIDFKTEEIFTEFEISYQVSKGALFENKTKLNGKIKVINKGKKILTYLLDFPKDLNLPFDIEIIFTSDKFEQKKLSMYVEKNDGCLEDVGKQTTPYLDSDTFKVSWYQNVKEFNDNNPLQWIIYNGYQKSDSNNLKDDKIFYKLPSNQQSFNLATGKREIITVGKNRIWVESKNRIANIIPQKDFSKVSFLENNAEKWTIEIPLLDEFNMPFFTDKSFLYYLENKLVCINIQDGNKRWDTKVKYGETLNYAQFGFNYDKIVIPGDDWILCFDELTGKELWSVKIDNKVDENGFPNQKNIYFTHKPLVTKNNVWVAISDPPGDFYHPYKVRCYDSTNGKMLFDEENSMRDSKEQYEIKSLYECSDGVVVTFWQGGYKPEPEKYFIRYIDKNFKTTDIQTRLMYKFQDKFITYENQNGNLKCIDIANNFTVWTHVIHGKINTTSDYPWVGSEAFLLNDEGNIFIGANNNVTILSAIDGKIIWEDVYKNMFPIDFKSIDGVLYVCYQREINSNNSVLVVYDIIKDKILGISHPFFGENSTLTTFLGKISAISDYIVDMRKIANNIVLITTKFIICYTLQSE